MRFSERQSYLGFCIGSFTLVGCNILFRVWHEKWWETLWLAIAIVAAAVQLLSTWAYWRALKRERKV
jgi:uncharacterized membrane protein